MGRIVKGAYKLQDALSISRSRTDDLRGDVASRLSLTVTGSQAPILLFFSQKQDSLLQIDSTIKRGQA
jgi:hypothetical protein